MDNFRKIGNSTLYCGDCFDFMPLIPTGSIDAIIADLPYGTTQCKWDTVLPFEQLWAEYKRLIKPNGVVVLFGSEPFTSLLVTSNLKMFKYNWIWQKTNATGFFDAKKKPLNDNETISIFYEKQPTYNPQMTVAEKIHKRGLVKRIKSDCYGHEKDYVQIDTGMRYPKRIIEICNANKNGIKHPTQKPVALMEYLVRTYTNEGDTVLDNTMGSGTTGVACMNTNRAFIGIEKEKKYFDIAAKRISETVNQTSIFN